MFQAIAWVYILIPVVLAAVVNMIVHFNGWTHKDNLPPNTLLPPGYVVGAIWTLIFGLLGFLMYIVKDNSWSVIFIALFLIYSLAYPFISSRAYPLLNLWALVLAFLLLVILLATHVYEKIHIILLMTPLIIWATYVNTIYAF